MIDCPSPHFWKTMQFKIWSRQDPNPLSVKHSHEFNNLTLLADCIAKQLKNYKTSFPVSEHIVLRWTKESGFRYEKHKKSYYVDRHKDPYVVHDRNTYLITFLSKNIYDHCWVQMTKEKYLKATLSNL